ncbi:hypothetical protein GCM10011591_35750 [Nocardia camponoti]|uniref:2-amino-4-hydroxy-6-hydroxymethyldihydropteridine diphosphokinase n=1 Tax=Nocardia camponoti TaxID=1616106 RepID=A0A917QNH9_9NOCA|nr:hypothetical protein GCM10011591_35750 [Nocardia camponoti]
MTRAVLSIGGNLGDRLANLRSVVAALGDRVVAVSGVYSTAPWGGVEQDDYLNAVVIAEDSTFAPLDWLRFGQELEQRAHRVREVRWGARTLDVDVVSVSDGDNVFTSADPTLTLPHPQAANRAFVLTPWLDADPAAHLNDAPIANLLAALPPAERDGVIRTDLSLIPENSSPASSPNVDRPTGAAGTAGSVDARGDSARTDAEAKSMRTAEGRSGTTGSVHFPADMTAPGINTASSARRSEGFPSCS